VVAETRHIVVVDDEEVLRRLYGFHLELAGYRVTRAASGEEALRAARSDAPDLILLDLMLGGTSGWDVLEELLADPQLSAVPVVILSALADEADELKARDAGASAYLAKPLPVDDLLAAVGRVLDRAH
jgi:DNA-binding response OmpR family regulator